MYQRCWHEEFEGKKMVNEKYFHIGDLISFYSGRSIVNPVDLTAPDGTKRPGDQGISPMLAIADHLDGRTFWMDKTQGLYDGDRLGVMLPHLRESLEKQLPWLKDYPREAIPQLPGETPAADRKQFYLDFVATAAASHGGEWFKVSPAPPTPLSKLNFGTLKLG